MEVLKAVSFLVLICACWAEFTYTDCGSHGIIHSVTSPPCDMFANLACIRERGQTYTTQINFTATQHSTQLTSVCHIIISGNLVEFAVAPRNACGNGLHCPLQPGQAEVFTINGTVPTFSPSMRLAVKFEVVDQDGHDLICIVFPAFIL